MSAKPALETLVINRKFSASIQRVFEAWTTPNVLASWFGPENFSVTDVRCNLVMGGEYEIVIQSPEGRTIKHYGLYVDISPPHKLVFTWVLENQDCVGSEGMHADTLVSIELTEIENGT